MFGAKQAHWAIWAVGCAAILAAILVGVRLRMEDPSSSPVIPAEDPYTHMALVREHVRDGKIDALNPGSRLYPPGMHAYVAAVWTYTGLDLYDIIRLGPVFLGTLSVLGVGLLLSRSDGPVAGFVGALTLAVAPEAITRTTMLSPTATDLAVIPFFLYALLEVAQGRLAWAGVAAPLALFLVFSHPWVVTVLALSGVVFALLAVALPWPAARGRAPTSMGLAACTVILGLAWGLSLSGCAGYCGPGFEDVYPGGRQVNMFGPFIIGAAVVAAALLAWGARGVDRLLQRPAPDPSPTTARTFTSLAILLLIVLVTIPAAEAGFPEFVHPDTMFGWPLLILAAVGLILLPLIPSPAAHVGAAIGAVTYPFVIYNPFHSEFWPHRTAVYMGVGLAILAGAVAGAMARAGLEAVQAREAAPEGSKRRLRPFRAVVPVLLVLVVLGGTVYAATPQPDNAWYRLYEPCQFETLRVVADKVSADPRATVITGDWQSKLVIAALSTDASRVWYKGDFFTSNVDHAGILQRGPVYVVVDPYLKQETPAADTTFLHSPPWQEWKHSCDGTNPAGPVIVYIPEGTWP